MRFFRLRILKRIPQPPLAPGQKKSRRQKPGNGTLTE